MKEETKIQETSLKVLESISKIIAYFICIGLLLASSFIVFDAFAGLFRGEVDIAVQDGLFVLILLEMFYVTRSFIIRGTINVSIVISMGIIAAVKEMIFQLSSLTLQMAIAFGVIFTTLALTYFIEKTYYEKIGKQTRIQI